MLGTGLGTCPMRLSYLGLSYPGLGDPGGGVSGCGHRAAFGGGLAARLWPAPGFRGWTGIGAGHLPRPWFRSWTGSRTECPVRPWFGLQWGGRGDWTELRRFVFRIPPSLRSHVWIRRLGCGMRSRRGLLVVPGPGVDERFRRCLGSLVRHPAAEPRQVARVVVRHFQKSTGAGTASSASSLGPIPILSWMRFSMSLAMSGLSRRNLRAFSLPCPSWSPS
jgi:hypothetical protein